jgi:hypothetical protein
MASKSRIVVEFEENEYGVVLAIEGLFVDEVKELIVEKLKIMYDGFENAKAGYLTLYSDEGRTVQITDKKMPVGDEFYAKLEFARQVEIPFDEIIVKAASRLNAPSTFGKLSNWPCATAIGRDEHCLTMHHRPPGTEEGLLHISLFSRAFAHFFKISSDSTAITRDDCEFASRFVLAMSLVYANEHERQRNAVNMFQKFFGRQIVSPTQLATDGSIITDGSLIVNFEFKNEHGLTGSDPLMQNIGYYIKYWGQPELESIRKCSILPTILLQIEGASLSVFGAIYVRGQVRVDPLCDTVHLLFLPDDRPAMIRLAMILRSIKVCIPRIEDSYKVISPNPEFPSICELRNGQSFKYVKELSRHVFLAKMNSTEEMVCVKFSPIGFCRAAHDILYNGGFSPRLLDCFEVDPWWTVSIMEFIQGASQYYSSPNPNIQLRRAISILHEHDLVYADLRPPNILITATNDKVYFVDFEFAGQHKIDRYPFFLNHANIEWPPGVSDGGLLDKDHDIWFMEKIL